MKTKSKLIGRYGLTGNSGLIDSERCFHVSMPYDCNGLLFVETEDGERWERMTRQKAKQQKRNIITCYHCFKPAVRLDHLWPYHSEMNACKDHAIP